MQNLESFYKNYELWDSGEGRRLERFGQYMLDRPASQADYPKKLDSFIWGRADFSFDDGLWKDANERTIDGTHEWCFDVSGLKMMLRLSEKGQVGVFPEQFDNWAWISETIESHLKKNGKSSYSEEKKFMILNAFSYTGGASIFSSFACKSYPSEVCHLDGSKSAVNWASNNASLNGLCNIRWIVDDSVSFIRRELKRGKFYNGIILDPPAFGRGKNKTWTFRKDLQSLFDMIKGLISPAGPVFFVLTSHDPDISKIELREMLSGVLSIPSRYIDTTDMLIPSVRGNSLYCGISVRFKKP